MQRRDFLRGATGMLLNGAVAGIPCQRLSIPALPGLAPTRSSQASERGMSRDQSGPIWLSYPSDANEVWLSAGVLVNARQNLFTDWILGSTATVT